jgi:hypothetical protein
MIAGHAEPAREATCLLNREPGGARKVKKAAGQTEDCLRLKKTVARP